MVTKGTSDVSAKAFFGVGPNVATGDFLSDPRCYYDQGTQRWFITILDTGDLGYIPGGFGRSFQLIAVSETSNAFGQDYSLHEGACYD